MKKRFLVIAMMGVMGWQGTALAEMTLEERLQRMEQRLKQLESRVASQDRVIQEKERQIAELQTREASGGGLGEWWQGVEMSGVVEVEASHTDSDGFSGADTSDIAVATVELGIDARINDWTRANVTLLYEEDDTPLDVDAATITIGNAEVTPIYFTAGRMAVPFGNFESHMVSDPLTLEIGETYETVAQLGFEKDGLYGSAYLFNGDQDDGGDEVDDFGLNLGYAWEQGTVSGDIGVSYIDNLADSDGLGGHIDTVTGGTLRDDVAGYGVHAILRSGPFSFVGEYVTASDHFAATEMQFNGAGAEPEAWNLEVAYAFELAGRESTVAIGYQETDEALALGLPESRTSIALSIALMEDTSLAFEWAHDEDYGRGDVDAVSGAAGSGNDADTVTVQLAVEF